MDRPFARELTYTYSLSVFIMTPMSFLNRSDSILIDFLKAQQLMKIVRLMLLFHSQLDLAIVLVRFTFSTPLIFMHHSFPGQRFALLEEKVILSTLFRRFSFRATQTIDELQLSFEAIMRPTVPIQLLIEQRQRP
jgi:hypothetical protein